jgi:hypothetical protein
VPVISGYVTSRLYATDWFAPTISGTPETTALVTFENVGNTQFSVLLRETDDRSVSGTRYNLMGAVAVVPGGQKTSSITNRRPYMELYCTGTTTGNLRMQIDSQRQWNELGFAKDDPYYPPQLFQAKEVPGPI